MYLVDLDEQIVLVSIFLIRLVYGFIRCTVQQWKGGADVGENVVYVV